MPDRHQRQIWHLAKWVNVIIAVWLFMRVELTLGGVAMALGVILIVTAVILLSLLGGWVGYLFGVAIRQEWIGGTRA